MNPRFATGQNLVERPDCRDVSVPNLLADIAALILPRVKAKGLELLIEPPHFNQHLIGNPARLTLALFELATNAVALTDTGCITLRCHVLEKAWDRLLLRFEVDDNATTPGRCLAITRKLAGLMGGTAGICCISATGNTHWLTTWLRIAEPLDAVATEPESDPLPADADADAETRLRQGHAGKHVLIVEDDLINQEVALDLLGAVKLVAELANNGVEALDMTRARRFDPILMDVQMPLMDGLEATRQIRRASLNQNTPILAMTANTFDDDRKKCAAAGMDAFLPKPVDPGTFYAMLLARLTGRL